MEPFYITLRRNYRDLNIRVEQTLVDERREQYTVIGRNKTIVLENNRPLWLAKSVRHRMDWNLVSGQVPYASALEQIYKAIEAHIKKTDTTQPKSLRVPITFEYKGKVYHGEFEPISGAGGEHWALSINKYHRGQLHYSQAAGRWLFDSNSGHFKELQDYFEAYMVGWFQ